MSKAGQRREDDETRRVGMEHARRLEEVVSADESPLAHARLKRQLTIDEVAKRAGVAPEELQWLEEGRLYRFPTPDRALLVTLLCATALGVDHREALELAGLPTPPLPANPLRRLGALRRDRGARRRGGARRRARAGGSNDRSRRLPHRRRPCPHRGRSTSWS